MNFRPHINMRSTNSSTNSSDDSESDNPGTSLVITIDGPAGAGKSTVARHLSARLGFDFLDTGAMYRCVTLAVMRSQLDTGDAEAVERLARGLTLHLSDSLVTMNGEDVSLAIRTPEISMAIKAIADNVAVRKNLSELQRRWTLGRRVVTEGRDQGSEVFPDSPCKIFLVASNRERAIRRLRELNDRGISSDLDTVLVQQNTRDQEDSCRAVGSLRKAADAIEICTDGKSLLEVVDELHQTVVQRLSELGSGQLSEVVR